MTSQLIVVEPSPDSEPGVLRRKHIQQKNVSIVARKPKRTKKVILWQTLFSPFIVPWPCLPLAACTGKHWLKCGRPGRPHVLVWPCEPINSCPRPIFNPWPRGLDPGKNELCEEFRNSWTRFFCQLEGVPQLVDRVHVYDDRGRAWPGHPRNLRISARYLERKFVLCSELVNI